MRRCVSRFGPGSPFPRWAIHNGLLGHRQMVRATRFRARLEFDHRVVAFLGGANMLMTGILGVYVGRIYSEVKHRPLYLVDRAVGFDRTEGPASSETSAPFRRRA